MFGQNFLVNTNVQQRIIEACRLQSTDTVIEIGPGQGAITQYMVDKVDNLTIIEKDKELIKYLDARFSSQNVKIINDDILQYPFEKIPANAIIVGNLPYNIATAIIKKFIEYGNSSKNIQHLYFMVQLEHGKKMCAPPGSKDYGSFSCLVQYYTTPQILFKISNGSFNPKPKVQSCFVHIEIPSKPKFAYKNKEALFKIIYGAFNQRRKTIENALSQIIEKNRLNPILIEEGINPKSRAENLSLEDYIRITKRLEPTLKNAD